MDNKYESLFSKMLYKKFGYYCNTVFALCINPHTTTIQENEALISFGKKCREMKITAMSSTLSNIFDKITIKSNELKELIKEYENNKNYQILRDTDINEGKENEVEIEEYNSNTLSDNELLIKPLYNLPLPLLYQSNDIPMIIKTDPVLDSIEFIHRKVIDIENTQKQIQNFCEELKSVISKESIEKIKKIYGNEYKQLNTSTSSVCPPFILPSNCVTSVNSNYSQKTLFSQPPSQPQLQQQLLLLKEYKQKNEQCKKFIEEYKSRINKLEKECEDYKNEKARDKSLKEKGVNLEVLLQDRNSKRLSIDDRISKSFNVLLYLYIYL